VFVSIFQYNYVSIGANAFFIIISLLQSTVRPLQYLAISLDLWLLASSSCLPSRASRHSTWPAGDLHNDYLDVVSTPELGCPSGYLFYCFFHSQIQNTFIRPRYLNTPIDRQNLYHPLQNYREAWYGNNIPHKLIQFVPQL
jgi:hypothetical protein